MIGSVLHDARIAFRGLWKSRGFTTVTVLTLAVAIGAITAIFSVLDAVVLKPLPYPDADRIVSVSAATLPQTGGDGEAPFSDRGYWHFLNNNRAFESFGGYEGIQQWPLTGDGPPLPVDVGIMTVSAFEVLRMQPERGQRCGVGVIEDTENAALLVQPVFLEPACGVLVKASLLCHGRPASSHR